MRLLDAFVDHFTLTSDCPYEGSTEDAEAASDHSGPLSESDLDIDRDLFDEFGLIPSEDEDGKDD